MCFGLIGEGCFGLVVLMLCVLVCEFRCDYDLVLVLWDIGIFDV